MGAMRYSAWALTALSAVLWGVAVAAIWVPVEPAFLGDDRMMAATATIVAVFLGVSYRLRDRDKDALVRSMAEVTMRRGEAPTRTDLKRVV